MNDVSDKTHKYLLKELIIRDLKLRYGRPRLSFFWAFLSPLLTTCIFYFVFGKILKVKIEEAPFFLYLMTGVFSWSFFQDSVLQASTSLLNSKNLIKEARFPLYFIPLSIVLTNLINFIPALFIIAVFCILLKGLSVFIWMLPFVLTLQAALAVGLAIIFSFSYIRFRDLKFILEACFMFLFYTTPVFYSLSQVKAVIPSAFYPLYLCNPLVGILNLYRISLLNGFYQFTRDDVNLFNSLAVPFIFTSIVLLFVAGLYRKLSKNIHDHISY